MIKKGIKTKLKKLDTPVTKKDLKVLEASLRKDLASKKDLKLFEASLHDEMETMKITLQYQMTEMYSEIKETKKTTDKILNLMDAFAKSESDRIDEFVIVKARLDRVEVKVGLREVAL